MTDPFTNVIDAADDVTLPTVHQTTLRKLQVIASIDPAKIPTYTRAELLHYFTQLNINASSLSDKDLANYLLATYRGIEQLLPQ